METKKINHHLENSCSQNLNFYHNKIFDFDLPNPEHEILQKFEQALLNYFWSQIYNNKTYSNSRLQ